MFRWRLVTGICALASSGILPASIFDHDDRISTARGDLPVGVVAAATSRATGFLISECHALTARHVFRASRVVGTRTTLSLKPWEPFSSANASPGTVMAVGAGNYRSNGYNSDWALIRLDRCLGREHGFIPLSHQGFYRIGSADRIDPALVGAGFPIDRGRRALTIDPSCTVRERTAWGLRHDCAVLPGNSGGPIMRWDQQSNRYEVIAIAIAGYPNRRPTAYTSERGNFAVDIAAVRAEIETAWQNDVANRR